MKHKWLHGSLLAVGLFLLSPMASAAVIGTLRVSSGPGNVVVSATSVDFVPPVGGPDGPVQTTSNINYGPGEASVLPSETLGRIRDFTTATPFPIMNFISFAPNVFFDLTGLDVTPPAGGTNCAALANGASCVAVAGSPIILTRIGNNTSVTLSAFGVARDTTPIPSNFSGLFTTQIANATPGQIQSIITSGGSVTSSFSGEFAVVPIPEPGTVSMLLLGGALLVARRVRKNIA